MSATAPPAGPLEITGWSECLAALHGTEGLTTDAYRLLWRDLSGIRDFVALPGPSRQVRREVLAHAFGRSGAPARREAIGRAVTRSRRLAGDVVTVADVTAVQAAATYELLGLDPGRGPEIEAAAAMALGAGSVEDLLATRTVFHDVLRDAAEVARDPAPYTLLAEVRRRPELDRDVDIPLLFGAFVTTLAVDARRDLPCSVVRQLASAPLEVQERVRVERAHGVAAQEALRLQDWLAVPRGPSPAAGAPGSVAMVRIGRANRDPAVFTRPDTFDPWRPERRRSLSFGAGSHRCPGRRFAITLASGVAAATLDDRLLRPDPTDDDILAVRSRRRPPGG